MDAKTYEYMTERTTRYKECQKRIDVLVEIKKSVSGDHSIVIGNRDNHTVLNPSYSSYDKEFAEDLRQTVTDCVDRNIARIQGEMDKI